MPEMNARITIHKPANQFGYLTIECDDEEIMRVLKSVLPKEEVIMVKKERVREVIPA